MVERVLLICLGLFLIAGGVFALGCGISYKIRKELPPGYTFLCNEDGKYKWSGSGWIQGYGSSKQEAINSAWRRHGDGEFTYSCDVK